MEKVSWQAQLIFRRTTLLDLTEETRDLDRRSVYDILVGDGSYEGVSCNSFARDIHCLGIHLTDEMIERNAEIEREWRGEAEGVVREIRERCPDVMQRYGIA